MVIETPLPSRDAEHRHYDRRKMEWPHGCENGLHMDFGGVLSPFVCTTCVFNCMMMEVQASEREIDVTRCNEVGSNGTHEVCQRTSREKRDERRERMDCAEALKKID